MAKRTKDSEDFIRSRNAARLAAPMTSYRRRRRATAPPRRFDAAGRLPSSESETVDEDGLTPREATFVREWLLDRNTTRAAMRAGFAPHNPNCARVSGFRLLRKATVSAAIDRRQRALEKALDMGVEELARRLVPLASANIADYIKVTPDGKPQFDLSRMTREQAAGLQEVTLEDFIAGRGENAREVRRIRIRLADRIAATRTLAEILGILRRRIEVEDVTPAPVPAEVVKRLSDDQLRRLVAIGERAKREQRAILDELTGASR